MAARIISGLLILVSFYIGVSHGSRVFQKPSAEYIEMMTALGITDTIRTMLGVCSILAAVLILFPTTFFIGNVLRAELLIVMMSLALKAGNYKFALIEIPFLLMPLALIYLGHPFKNGI
ncbi:hypothetical protein J2X69_004195 [Algoriphagus sp. 4150]|uniref:DoxX family protein n=1 Tax=Algoriphagus sp. 4150 TaxID=2817756 RepID=UPI00285853D2|nr:DoxX family protein [Algoriphagus sp. 4150]MDR7131830.1 hypothetical protein [Algoriphagus sp. 4150]